jgi:hypothetical protein
MILLRKRRNQVSGMGDFFVRRARLLSDRSEPFAVQLCSLQAGRCVTVRENSQPVNFKHEYRSPTAREDKRGVDLISDVLPFVRLWYGEPNAIGNVVGYANHRSRSHDAVIRVLR